MILGLEVGGWSFEFRVLPDPVALSAIEGANRDGTGACERGQQASD
jgi:hypothetical protein